MFGPLPEGLDNPVLEKMLQVAPCPEPLKEDTAEDNTGRRGPPNAFHSNRGSERLHEGRRPEEEKDCGRGSEAEASIREKKSRPEGPTLGGAVAAQSPRGHQFSRES